MNEVTRHPVRGVLWGVVLGLGLYGLLVGRKVVVLGSWAPLIVSVAAGVALGLLWSLFGPAKKTSAPALKPASPSPPWPTPQS